MNTMIMSAIQIGGVYWQIFLNVFWWERMSFDSKNHCSNRDVCNRAKPSRQGSASLSPLGVPKYPWEIVGMDFVTDIFKSLKLQHIAILILVWHLKKLLTLFLVIKKLPPKRQHISLLTISIDFMVFLK